MKLNRLTWLSFILLSIASIFAWIVFSYPQLAFIHFKIDRLEALKIAQDYLKNRGENYASYQHAIIFEEENHANGYLQKTMGFDQLKKFIKKHDFDLFFWFVRFYKENQKEEYRMVISASTGEITSFHHIIEDSSARREINRDESRKRVTQFLADRFDFKPGDHSIKGDLKNQFDSRAEYSFSWMRNDVNIPWSEVANSGTGRLITGATISGDEILSFAKNSFDIPDQFNRYIDHIRNIGQNISVFIKIIYYTLITGAVFFLITRRDHLVMHSTKKFYLKIVIFSFILSLLTEANLFQEVLFGYRTTQPFDSFLGRFMINTVISILFSTVVILVPSLAGELLRCEIFKEKNTSSFLPHILTTFFSRSVASAVFLGYFVCLILLGIQSLLIKFGQDHLGVWVEYNWIGHLSTAYIPALAAFTIGFQASFTEEILYRMFTISWGKKIFKNTAVAAVLASLIWGFAHSNYPVYPSWFRGIEVSCLGFFLSFVYLRFGLIPVLVGHYLFDVFWSSSGYILGQTNPLHYLSCLFVFLLPFLWGIAAYMINRKEIPVEMRWHLNQHQIYNLDVLKTYLIQNQKMTLDKPKKVLREDIISHGWDVAVVDIALDEIYQNKTTTNT